MSFANLRLILVPTDFSEAAAVAIDAAVELARTFHAAIEVLHVDVDPTLVLPPPADIVAIPLVFESTRASAAEQLEQVLEGVRVAGVTCTGSSQSGRTYTAIVEQARKSVAGLIVMGTHARHGISHALLGSVAEKVVEHAPCPVLVVPGPVPAPAQS